MSGDDERLGEERFGQSIGRRGEGEKVTNAWRPGRKPPVEGVNDCCFTRNCSGTYAIPAGGRRLMVFRRHGLSHGDGPFCFPRGKQILAEDRSAGQLDQKSLDLSRRLGGFGAEMESQLIFKAYGRFRRGIDHKSDSTRHQHRYTKQELHHARSEQDECQARKPGRPRV